MTSEVEVTTKLTETELIGERLPIVRNRELTESTPLQASNEEPEAEELVL